MQEWKRIEPTKVQKVGWRTVVTKTFALPNGQTVTFDTVWPEGRYFVHTIALTFDNKVVVSRCFRAGPEKVLDELPGGFVDKGETPEQAAKRELLEETGYDVGEIISLGISHKDTYMNATWESFLATNCRKVADCPTSHEVEEQVISIDELIANAKGDNMTDGIAVLLAYDKLLELKGGMK